MSTPTTSSTPRERRPLAHPLAWALALEAFFVGVIAGGALLLKVLVPGLPGYSLTGPSAALVVAAVAAVAVLGLVAALHWWRFTGFTRPSQWRDLHVYWLPIVLIFAPFVAGAKVPAPATIGLLFTGYLLSIVFEEVFFRGVVLGMLRPLGLWPAVLISSVLFGLTHMSNQLLRGVSVLIVLQAFGAAIQGIGYAGLRLRTNTIWVLLAVHLLHDVTLQMGHLPIALVEAPIDTILAVYGIILLRRRGRRHVPAPVPAPRVHQPAA